MAETEQLKLRLQAITEKRKIQEEIERKKQELEEEKLKLQRLKRCSLREQWLMEGSVGSSGSDHSPTRHPESEGLTQLQQLEETINRLQREISQLEGQMFAGTDAESKQTRDTDTQVKEERKKPPVPRKPENFRSLIFPGKPKPGTSATDQENPRAGSLAEERAGDSQDTQTTEGDVVPDPETGPEKTAADPLPAEPAGDGSPGNGREGGGGREREGQGESRERGGTERLGATVAPIDKCHRESESDRESPGDADVLTVSGKTEEEGRADSMAAPPGDSDVPASEARIGDVPIRNAEPEPGAQERGTEERLPGGPDSTPDTGEHARDTGEHARDTGEHARDTGEHTTDTGEHARDTGEHAKDTGEHARDTGEHARDTEHTDTGEHARYTGEHTRDTGEHTRDTGERARELGEHAREPGEHAREPGEHAREPGEHGREPGEHGRDKGEHGREPGEHARDTREHARGVCAAAMVTCEDSGGIPSPAPRGPPAHPEPDTEIPGKPETAAEPGKGATAPQGGGKSEDLGNIAVVAARGERAPVTEPGTPSRAEENESGSERHPLLQGEKGGAGESPASLLTDGKAVVATTKFPGRRREKPGETG
ncbi:paralemmin-3-like [Callorhinchus milii]|uniref:paralemmin-3-like n=1 Tax=Callorhinchus milii TaxID=7868 RepID=UPI001C3F6A75|nr:paralemmin-3-like [Callorhinchus milii]